MPGKFTLAFITILVGWIILTASLAVEELIVGILVSLIVSAVASKGFTEGRARGKIHPRRWAYFLAFLAMTAWREITAHLRVIAIILSPWLSIQPGVVELRSSLKKESTLTALANSITITPGTATVDIDKSKLWVHCIDKTDRKGIVGKTESLLGGVER